MSKTQATTVPPQCAQCSLLLRLPLVVQKISAQKAPSAIQLQTGTIYAVSPCFEDPKELLLGFIEKNNDVTLWIRGGTARVWWLSLPISSSNQAYESW